MLFCATVDLLTDFEPNTNEPDKTITSQLRLVGL